MEELEIGSARPLCMLNHDPPGDMNFNAFIGAREMGATNADPSVSVTNRLNLDRFTM